MSDKMSQKKRVVITVIIAASIALAAYVSAFFKDWT